MRLKGIGFVLSLVLTGCAGEYDVGISFVDANTKRAAQRVQVAIVTDCSQQSLGEAPIGTVRSVEFRTDETSPALGEVEPGSYGLYARASDADCNVIAAGCTPITLEASSEAALTVQLGNVSVALCGTGIACSAGQCVGGDDASDGLDAAAEHDAGPGPDASSDAGTDAGTDAATDAGTDAGFDAGFDAGTDAGPPSICEDPRDPLVAWYRMDDDDADRVFDSSEHELHARCVRPCPLPVSGPVGRALEFTSSTGPVNARFNVEQQALFDGSRGFSVAAFARFGNTGEDMTIVAKEPYGYWIGVNDLGTHLEVWTSSITLSLSVPLDFRAGEWGHIVVTWDPSDRVIRSYQNGVFSSASASVSIDFDATEGELTIGSLRPAEHVEPWDGALDEIRFYNTPLSPAQIAELAACN